MKKLIAILFSLLLGAAATAGAQTADQPVGVKLFTGTQGYDGDLANELIQFSDYDFLYGVGLAAYLGPHWDASLDLQWMILDVTNDENEQHPARRNTSFEADNLNLTLLARWKPFRTRLNPYLAAGLGANFLRDRSDARAEEAQFSVSVPLGLGFNYQLTEQVMLNVQATYHRTFSDGLDNYPLSAGEAAPGVDSRPDFDGTGHDDFLTTSVGIVFNFGGGPMDKGDAAHRQLLRRSRKHMEAIEATAEEATQALRDARQLNAQTAAALDSLRDATGQPDKESEDLKAELGRIVNNVQFEFDSAKIIEPAYDELNTLAAILDTYPNLALHVEGRADERGSGAYNETLARERAEAVKAYLADRGVAADRMRTTAVGEEDPVMSGASETAHSQNRSVRMTLRYRNNH